VQSAPQYNGFEGYSDGSPSWDHPGAATCRPCSPDWAERALVAEPFKPHADSQAAEATTSVCETPGALSFSLLRPLWTTIPHLQLPLQRGPPGQAALFVLGGGATRARIFIPRSPLPLPQAPPERLVHLLACILLEPHPSPRDPRSPPPPNCPAAFPMRPGAAAIHFPATGRRYHL